ncbi:putative MFS aflatoxin efflux pump [Annulohypoxylon truncatum]|uniref:putative MFS aflatoxin efflux pump n=1 Tax=Annulohypoxylon truncatum TaxID=327061 RepID=UPI002008054C|nr:putative MFS aflatoxin efflux pump [Annulohypoxylon truncatum]KAI1214518.1 putative MFS aflatoxin efflux pump [Annulohypoxylon truncatum]
MLFRRDKKDQPPLAVNSDSASASAPATATATSNSPTDKIEEPQENTNPVNGNPSDEEEIDYPTGVRLALVLISVFVSMFLVALDRLIISTAIPAITDEFHSLPDVGWYGSAYLLTTCAFQLLFGKVYTFFPVRTTFLATIFLFEAGSAICGAAPNSVAFILGRAIQGVGSAGIFGGSIVSIVYSVPLHKRPLYLGFFGAVFGLASVIGPLVGGAFTSNVTWRWCFYINLPFGGIAMFVIAFLLHVPDRKTTKIPTKAKLAQLDAIGTTLLIPGVVCLLLALQWGGLTYAWSNGRIIALLTLGVALFIGFAAVQVIMPKTATIPPRIFNQRSILAGNWATTCIGASMIVFVYFLPIWFQAIKGTTAVDSGIRLLPITLSMVVASITNGIFVSKLGYYTPSMIIGTALMSVGAGLLTTLQQDTTTGKWIGYQILFGFGMGMCFQAPNLAAQTVLPTRDVPIGTSLVFFCQLLAGAIFLSVGQNVLDNQLLSRLSGLPGFEPSMIEDNGATTLSSSLPAELLPTVLVAYNEALRQVFRLGLCLSCLTMLGSVCMEWRSVKENKPKAPSDPESNVDSAQGIKSDGETLAEKAEGPMSEPPITSESPIAKNDS